jgi:hypothetical protein
MTSLSKRKTRLKFATNATVSTGGWRTYYPEAGKKKRRYARIDRQIIIEAKPETALVRLAGTRTVYEISWRGIYDYAARVIDEKARAEKKANKKGDLYT